MRDANDSPGPGVFSNSLVNLTGLVVVSGLGALGGLLVARTLGREGVGMLAVAWGFVELGRAITGCTHVPSILWAHKGHDERAVFGTSLAVKALLSAVVVGLLGILAPTLSETFRVPAFAFVVAGTALLVNSAYEVGAARLEARNRMVRSNLVLATGSVVWLASLGALALMGQLTVLTSILSTLASNAVMSLGAIAFALRGLRLRIDVALGREMTTYGLRILAAAFLAQGLLWVDTLMVSYLLGNAAAGVYQVVFLLTFVIVSAATAMGVALVPALGVLVGRGADTSRGYQRGTLIALGLGLGLGAVYLVAGQWILGLYGDAFVEGYPALVVLTLFGVSAALAVPASTMLTVHGHAGTLTRLALAQLALNVVLNYVLIQRLGILGAALATTAVFALGTAAMWWLVHRRVKAVPFSRETFGEARSFIVAAIGRSGRRRA